jgi:membrane-associated phospholipid phosphatase
MRARPAVLSCSLIAAAACVAATASADPRALAYDPNVDVPVAVAGLYGWVATEMLKPCIAPERCRLCGVPAGDAAARDALVWRTSPNIADTASWITLGLAAGSAIGVTAGAACHDGRCGNAGADTLLVTEATALAMSANQAIKYLAGRQRPFVHYRNQAVLCAGPRCKRPDPADDNLSFFSGHTTAAFALAASSGTVATMRGYRWAPWVWAQGMTLAVATGYLRIAADRHYLSDVLTGMIVGAGLGATIPYLWHRPRDNAGGVAPAPGGAMLSFGGVF